MLLLLCCGEKLSKTLGAPIHLSGDSHIVRIVQKLLSCLSKSTKLLTTKQSNFEYWSNIMPTLVEYIKIMTLDDFKLWNSLTLKFYRSWIGKPTTLSSDALAVR